MTQRMVIGPDVFRMPYPVPVLWVDPGQATGVAIIHFDLAFLLEGAPVRECVRGHWSDTIHSKTENQIVNELVGLVQRLPGHALVGTEDFILYGDKESAKGGRPLLSPVRVNAKFDFALHRMGHRPLLLQGANLIEKVERKHLEAAGLWWEGYGTKLGGHAKDATSHIMVFAKRAQKDKGIRRLFLGEEMPA